MTPAVLKQLLRGHARQSIMSLSAGGGAFIRPESTPMVAHNRDLAAQEGRQRLVADLPELRSLTQLQCSIPSTPTAIACSTAAVPCA